VVFYPKVARRKEKPRINSAYQHPKSGQKKSSSPVLPQLLRCAFPGDFPKISGTISSLFLKPVDQKERTNSLPDLPYGGGCRVEEDVR
jgi:hypothetical protein